MDEPVQAAVTQTWLALRQCATHPAGPLAAIHELRQAQLDGLDAFDMLTVEIHLRRRVRDADLLPERRRKSDDFLDVVFAGLASLEERGLALVRSPWEDPA